MTDREKLIALIKEGECGALALEDCSYCKYDGEDDCSYQLLADVLLANGVVVQRWIPVTERLPVDWCPVLVMVREVGEPLLGSYRENVWFHERWNTTFIDGAVTHWMPLPKPPKEGE